MTRVRDRPPLPMLHLSRLPPAPRFCIHLPTTWSHLPGSSNTISPDSAFFTTALKEQDYQYQSHFLRGVDEGMRLQKDLEEGNPCRLRVLEDLDARLFERCVQMEKVAKEKTEEFLRVKEELRHVKTQFEVMG